MVRIHLAALLLSSGASAFLNAAPKFAQHPAVRARSPLLFSSTKEKEEITTKTKDVNGAVEIDPDAEGLPWWWELVWKLDVMQKGVEGEPVTFGDSANVLRTNIEQIYGGFPSLDGCPLAEGDIENIVDGTMFIGLQKYQEKYESPYKLCFGPKSFLVISDPIQARHLLRDANTNYDKVRGKQLSLTECGG